MKKARLLLIGVVLAVLAGSVGLAAPTAPDLVASLSLSPGLIDSPDKGAYVDLVKAIAEVYPGKIKIEVYPHARAVQNIIEGKADFQLPKLRNPRLPESDLPYQFVTEEHGNTAFVIYSNKDKIITRKDLDAALAKGGQFPYAIDMVTGSESNFAYPGNPIANCEQALQKIQNKRSDALIWNQESSDLVVKDLRLNAIHREFYAYFRSAIVIPKGPKGDEIDKLLSECLRRLKASGRLQTLYRKIHMEYIEWQPTEMGW